MEIEEIIESISASGFEFLKVLRDEKFSLRDSTVSSRVYNLWKNEGLLDVFPNKDRKWVTMSFVELIWLNMVRDMRVFGLSFEEIRKIKKKFLVDIDQDKREGINEPKLSKAVVDLIKIRNKCSTQEAEQIIDEMKAESGFSSLDEFVNSFFGRGMTYLEAFLIMKGVLNKDSVLVIYLDHKKQSVEKRKNGKKIISDEENVPELDCHIYSEIHEEKSDSKLVRDYIFRKPNLQIPISHYVTSLIRFNLEKSKEIGWLSESEYEIINQIRQGKAKSISIRFKNKKPEILEVTNIGQAQIEADLLNALRNYKYANVSIKKVDGKIANYEVTQKYKLK